MRGAGRLDVLGGLGGLGGRFSWVLLFASLGFAPAFAQSPSKKGGEDKAAGPALLGPAQVLEAEPEANKNASTNAAADEGGAQKDQAGAAPSGGQALESGASPEKARRRPESKRGGVLSASLIAPAQQLDVDPAPKAGATAPAVLEPSLSPKDKKNKDAASPEATGSKTAPSAEDPKSGEGLGAVNAAGGPQSRVLWSKDERHQQLRKKAGAIAKLLAGKIDPRSDRSALFQLDAQLLEELHGASGPSLADWRQRYREEIETRERQLRRKIRRQRFRKKKQAIVLWPDTTDDPFIQPSLIPEIASGEAAEGYRKIAGFYFALSDAQREAMAEKLNDRAQRLADKEARYETLEQELAQQSEKVEQLRQFLAEELDPRVEPSELLRLDLQSGDTWYWERRDEAGPAGADKSDKEGPGRVGDAAKGPSEGPVDAAQPEGQDHSEAAGERLQKVARLEKQLQAQQAEFRGLRRKFYHLSESEQRRLWDSHTARQEALRRSLVEEQQRREQKKEEERRVRQERERMAGVAREKEAALQAAREAKTAAARLAAQEQARLLGIRAQQEQYDAELQTATKAAKKAHDEAMELVQGVSEQVDKGISNGLAEAYYQKVEHALQLSRSRLKERLGESFAFRGEAKIPGLGGADEPETPIEVDREKIDELRFEIQERAEQLRDLSRSTSWDLAVSRHEDVVELNRARLRLLSHVSDGKYSELTGLSGTALSTVVQELDQMNLELRVRVQQLRRRIQSFRGEWMNHAGSMSWVFIKLLFVIGLFRWWRSNANELLAAWRMDAIEHRNEYPILGRVSMLIWYLMRLRNPLEWLLLGWVVFKFFIPPDWVEAQLFWTVYKWIVVGSVVVALLNAVALHSVRRSRSYKDKTKTLRMDSLRMVCFTAMGMGLLLALAEQLVGKGAFFRWIRDGAWMIYIPMAIYLLVRWRPTVMERCGRLAATSPVAKWVSESHSLAMRIPATLVGALYLLGMGVAARVRGFLMGLESVRKAVAFMLRREVMSQDGENKGKGVSIPSPHAMDEQFDPDRGASELLDTGPVESIEKMILRLDAGRSSLTAVVGERGAGKSSFLTRLAKNADERIFDQVIDCPAHGLSGLYESIEAKLGASIGDPKGFEANLAEKGVQVLCVDNLHRLVRPRIGGLAELDEFISFARRWGHCLTWVVGFGATAWRYARRARGERVFFDEVIELPRWGEKQIVELLDHRSALAGIEADFEQLNLVRKDEQNGYDGTGYGFGEATDEQNAELYSNRRHYYRILWEYSGGNPGVTLHVWRRSLFQGPSQRDVVVRPFAAPNVAEIEKLPLPALFTLRAIVQLELATESEVIECTNLASADCTDAIRVILAAGYAERVGKWLRLSWDWYRPVLMVLNRQHLLAE